MKIEKAYTNESTMEKLSALDAVADANKSAKSATAPDKTQTGKSNQEEMEEIPIKMLTDLLNDLDEAKKNVDFYKACLEQRENDFVLSQLKAIDSSISSIEEMGKEFEHLLEAGVSVKSAYRLVREIADEKKTPPVMGDFSNAQNEKSEYFTFEQVKAMNKEDIKKNYDKVMKSQGKWKKNKTL